MAAQACTNLDGIRSARMLQAGLHSAASANLLCLFAVNVKIVCFDERLDAFPLGLFLIFSLNILNKLSTNISTYESQSCVGDGTDGATSSEAACPCP